MIIKGITGRHYERTVFHAMHILRSKLHGFKALSEVEYNNLCDKIEALPKKR